MDYRVLTATGASWFLLDQLSKTWAQSVYFKPMVLIENFFYFSLHKNAGIAFGIPLPFWLQISISTILIGVLVYWALGSSVGADRFLFPHPCLFGIILGGAIGNWVSRVAQREVVDFIVLKPFPVFNIADVGITIGLTLLFILSLKKINTNIHSK